jgi:hypothetical protein
MLAATTGKTIAVNDDGLSVARFPEGRVFLSPDMAAASPLSKSFTRRIKSLFPGMKFKTVNEKTALFKPRQKADKNLP